MEKEKNQKSGAKNKPSKMSRLSFLLLIVHRQASNVAEIILYKVYLEHWFYIIKTLVLTVST